MTDRYWPRWSSVTLVVTGGAIALLETDNLLFFVGLLFLGLGIYGLARRRPRSLPGPSPNRPPSPSGPTRPPISGRGTH